MATLLYRLGRWSSAHGWRVVAAWTVILIALGVTAGLVRSEPTDVVRIPDAQFEKVLDDLEAKVPEVSGNNGTAVFVTEDGTEFTPAQRRAVRDVISQWEDLSYVTSVTDPFAAQRELENGDKKLANAQRELKRGQRELLIGTMELDRGEKELALGRDLLADLPTGSAQAADLRAQLREGRAQLKVGEAKIADGRKQIEDARVQLARAEKIRAAAGDFRMVSKDGTTALGQIGLTIDPQSMAQPDRDKIVQIGESLADEGVQTYFGSELTMVSSVVGIGEVVGLVTAGVILLALLGSLIAAGLPILVALIGVAAGLSGAMAATYFFEMHSMTPALALMLGLAVGIDYTLFILMRHRTQLLRGMPLTESIGRAVGTSGNAVVFAGATVIVALVALVLSGLPILAQMGLVAAGAVFAAVLMSITLGPALMGLLGHRIASKRAWGKARTRDGAAADEEHGSWWVRLVTARPWLTVVGVLVLLGLTAFPAMSLRLGLPDGSSEEPSSSANKAYTTIADKFGPGANGPVLVTADLPADLNEQQTSYVTATLGENISRTRGVSQVVPVGSSDDKRTYAYQVVLDSGPTDEATTDTVHALLDSQATWEDSLGIDVGLTGRTVANIEISERLSGALPTYLAVVVGLSMFILVGVFRSVLVPVIATGGFLLSVGAAFGALVAVFQWGWLGSLFGVHTPGPLMSFGPILLIGVLFGLAMDYQMFLVSGMREAWAHGEDARKAVRTGFTHGAQVVLAAAGIMFAVFGGFVFSHMVMIRPIGFGLAVGVLVDALLVRMTLTPAILHLLGERAWWIPRWLDQLLPDLDVEGAKLSESLAAATPVKREREMAGTLQG